MRSSIVTIGETMALLGTPDHGLLRSGSAPSLTIGGAESNVAIAATQLGASTTWIGRVGDDDLGALVVRELRGQGVNVHAPRDPEAPTGLMVKEHRRGKPTHVRYYRKHSAGSRLGPDDLDQDSLAAADIVHLTGITAALGDTARAAMNTPSRSPAAEGRRSRSTSTTARRSGPRTQPPPSCGNSPVHPTSSSRGPKRQRSCSAATRTPRTSTTRGAPPHNSHTRSARSVHASSSSNSDPWAPWRSRTEPSTPTRSSPSNRSTRSAPATRSSARSWRSRRRESDRDVPDERGEDGRAGLCGTRGLGGHTRLDHRCQRCHPRRRARRPSMTAGVARRAPAGVVGPMPRRITVHQMPTLTPPGGHILLACHRIARRSQVVSYESF